MTLHLDWCSHEAAKYACKNWHYSKAIPAGKLVKIAVYENALFCGVIIFSRGASPNLLTRYHLAQTEGCELTRIALRSHIYPVTQMVAIALQMLRTHYATMRLIVSFADPEQGHVGGIYKAGNWIYTGTSGETVEYFVEGRWQHVRNSYHKVKGHNVLTRKRKGKYRYVMPLDKEIKRMAQTLAVPYPKSQARARSTDSGATNDQLERGGATPTRALISEGTQSNGKQRQP